MLTRLAVTWLGAGLSCEREEAVLHNTKASRCHSTACSSIVYARLYIERKIEGMLPYLAARVLTPLGTKCPGFGTTCTGSRTLC